MNRKRKETKQIVVVVVDGVKASAASGGLAPLRKAMSRVVGPHDEILVLTFLYVNPTGSLTKAGVHGGGQCSQSCERDPYVKSLHQVISQRKENYLQIFRPFYDSCKRCGVKFQVKVAAGYRPKDIIVEEANNANATWIVVDSCFARDLSFRLNGTDFNVSLVSDVEEAMAQNNSLEDDAFKNSMVMEVSRLPKSPKLSKESVSRDENYDYHSSPILRPCPPTPPSNISTEREHPSISQPYEEKKNVQEQLPFKEIVLKRRISSEKFSDANFLLELPQQLSWKETVDITRGFETAERIHPSQNKNLLTYAGVLDDRNTSALVKRYTADSSGILEAEKQAALYMHHKNILRLIGYHKSENRTVLVFPAARKGTLERYFCGFGDLHLTLRFCDKLKIAIGIAQGVRYMHEGCPRSPVVHGDLSSSNIFLRHDLRPMISGFGQSTWLPPQPASSPTSDDSFRCRLKDLLNHESMAPVKSDVLSFGILLLRLFCRISAPQDDKLLIEWARPLLIQRAFHELLEDDAEESEVSDMHGIYRVMTAAAECTRTNPFARPSMSEVIAILKGERFCTMQSSPSDNGF